MQEAVKRFVANRQEEKNGLLLVDGPTGFGKTHRILLLLKDYLEGKPVLPGVERIYYLSPLKKNVASPYEKLRKLIGNDPLFDANVLLLPAYYQSILDNFLSVRDQIDPVIRKTSAFMEVSKCVSACKTDLSAIDEGKPIFGDLRSLRDQAEQTLGEVAEPAFRAVIKEELRKYGHTKAALRKKIACDWQWLPKLYPSILLEDRKVVFMSVAKFCSTNDPIISGKCNFATSSLIKGALVIIDEIDSSKEDILRNQIEACRTTRIDLIKFASTMSGVFAGGREFPDDNFPPVPEGHPERNSRKVHERIKDLMLQRRDLFSLNYPFKLIREEPDDRNFLFQDYQLHTVSGADKTKHLYVSVDPKKRQNVIVPFAKEPKNLTPLNRLIHSLINAFNFTKTGFALMARNKLTYYNEHKKDVEDEMELEDAVSTMLFPFELDSGIHASFQKMVVDDFALPEAQQKRGNYDSDFYMDGFRYFDFVDALTQETVTSIFMYCLSETPEKFLYSLATKCYVVGLSATATLPTVTGNYNLTYLKEKLGPGYCVISEEDRRRIDAEIAKENGTKQYPMHVHVMNLDAMDMHAIATSVFQLPDNQEMFEYVLDSIGDDFRQRRFAKMVMAIKSFVHNPNSKAMLVLANNNLKFAGDGFYRKDILEQIVFALRSESECKTNVTIHPLHGQSFESERKKYLQEMRHGSQKVILFSSYQAAGTGQNLQYTIEDLDESERESIEKDIDSIYLEMPRNILVNVGFSQLNMEDLMKYIYQVESLNVAGELSTAYALSMIKAAFRVHMGAAKGGFKKGYDSNSVNNHAIRALMQGIGRICRVHGKESKAEANIYVDGEIFESVNFSPVIEQRMPMNPEFAALIRHAKNERQLVASNLIELTRAARKADELEDALEIEVRRDRWEEERMKRWDETRQTILSQPSPKGNPDPRLRNFYLFATNDMAVNCCYYQIYEGHYRLSYVPRDGYSEVSERACFLPQLMEIPVIRKYFEEKGFATTWSLGSAVINPVAFTNIYKGALGEQVGFVLLKSLGIKLEPISEGECFEKFDFRLAQNHDIYIDFKFWSDGAPTKKGQAEEREWILSKLDSIGGKKAFIINIIATQQFKESDSGRIYECPSLLRLSADGQRLEADKGQISKLRAKILEVL